MALRAFLVQRFELYSSLISQKAPTDGDSPGVRIHREPEILKTGRMNSEEIIASGDDALSL